MRVDIQYALSFHALTCRDKRMPPLVYLCLRSTAHQLGSLTETEINCASSTRRRISRADPLQDALLCIPPLLNKTKSYSPHSLYKKGALCLCCALLVWMKSGGNSNSAESTSIENGIQQGGTTLQSYHNVFQCVLCAVHMHLQPSNPKTSRSR